MVQVLTCLPLRCINLNGSLFKDNPRGAFHQVDGVGKTRQKRCIVASTQAYHHSEQTNRRSANFQPSSWTHILFGSINEKDKAWENQAEFVKKLEDEVSCMLDSDDLEPLALLELINDIDQLGLSYRYTRRIKIAIDKLRYLEEATGEVTKELHASALYFRLLRQRGCEISPDVFEKFRNENGNFNENLARDVRGILSLYEASHLACEGESILNEAKIFTSLHLKDSKECVDSNMSEEINHTLELPYHHRMRRLDARWKIESYAKRKEKNQVLLELAKLDFNNVQSILQSDVQEVSRYCCSPLAILGMPTIELPVIEISVPYNISARQAKPQYNRLLWKIRRWWKAVGLADKLDFARDRLMESFFWSVGMVPDPQFSKCRLAVTKAFTLITVLDDIYDVYGSLDELEQFTEAVVRWDLNAMKDLPNYMKLFFLALYNTINELAYDSLKEQGEIIIPHLKKAWADLCKAFLQEAQWYYKKVTPTFDEYIENGWVSSSGAVQLVHSYFLVTENISKEAIQCLDNHHDILRWPCTIFRLTNDFSSSTAEIERGETTNAISCCMHESGLSEEVARQHISKMIEECWMKINKQLLISSPFEENFVKTAVNIARIAVCQYQYGDAHSAPDVIARNRIFSVIMDPFQLRETENVDMERKILGVV